jgi:SSS family transporter
MSATYILLCISLYFLCLLLIAWYTGRNAGSAGYFLGNKASPWYIVAFGMISDSLSGVTFISVPGAVGTAKFAYLQLVVGYVAGYLVIAKILLPLYYRMNLISIYSYLQERFGMWSQKTGSFFFLLSRLLGAGARLYLAADVIQYFVFDKIGIPFGLSVSIVIALMLVYTYQGGIKTLVWTDTFQSLFLLLGVVLSIAAISGELNLGGGGLIKTIVESSYTETFFWDWKEKSFFFKQFLGGAFIAIAMTGLDQNMMQKNLSCRSLEEAQKNMISFSFVMALVNIFFLSLGVLLYAYADAKGIAMPLNPENGKPITDRLFPMLALEHLGAFSALVFIVGLTAATFSSADSVLTTLTTSFYIDFINPDSSSKYSERDKIRLRHFIHVAFGVLLLIVILIFKAINDRAIIDTVLTIAGFTYGPLLGLFAFGLFTRRKLQDSWVPVICVISPLIAHFFSINAPKLLGGYQVGYELLIINGAITYTGLQLISKKVSKN